VYADGRLKEKKTVYHKSSISSYGDELIVRVQTRTDRAGTELPVDMSDGSFDHWIIEVVHCLSNSKPVEKKQGSHKSTVNNPRGLTIFSASVVTSENGKPESVGKLRKTPVKTYGVAPE